MRLLKYVFYLLVLATAFLAGVHTRDCPQFQKCPVKDKLNLKPAPAAQPAAANVPDVIPLATD